MPDRKRLFRSEDRRRQAVAARNQARHPGRGIELAVQSGRVATFELSPRERRQLRKWRALNG